MPVIVGGDFNAEPDSAEIRELVENYAFIDTYAERGELPGFTWDPEHNTNTALSSGSFLDTNTSIPEIRETLEGMDLREGRIDYIFLYGDFTRDRIVSSQLFATHPLSGGLFCSDHFGVLTTLRF